jgi:hypothetical protein
MSPRRFTTFTPVEWKSDPAMNAIAPVWSKKAPALGAGASLQLALVKPNYDGLDNSSFQLEARALEGALGP